MRTLTYAEALGEAIVQCMEDDPSIVVAGEGVDDHKGTFGTTRPAFERFGAARVVDVPNSENATAGIAVGAAAQGLRPIVVHTRADFMFLALDALVNVAAKWRYMYGGRAGGVPVVTRGVVGRGWGQGATHSQSPHATFAHYPGLTVAVPASPADAKGMLVAALRGDDPVVLVENRNLYPLRGPVPSAPEPVPFGRARVVRPGSDVTVVAASLMVHEAERAAEELARHGVEIEIVDVRSVRPLDGRTICESVARTGRLVVADTSWGPCGVAAEVAAVVAETVPETLRAPVRRVTPPDSPAPVSWPLEEAWHPGANAITAACLGLVRRELTPVRRLADAAAEFQGPY